MWQILTRRGAITPQPQKRPKSATKRFVFARPNECWQSDWTGWSLPDGSSVAVAGSLDDHSRYLVGFVPMTPTPLDQLFAAAHHQVLDLGGGLPRRRSMAVGTDRAARPIQPSRKR